MHPLTRTRRALAIATVAAAVSSIGFTSPASAALTGDTTVTFTVGVAGGLSILPAPAVAGITSGNTVTGAITSVVTDLRTSAGAWTNTVSATDFALVGAASPSGTSLVPASAARMWTTSATVAVPGTATLTNPYTASTSALTLSTTGQELISAATSNANTTTLISNFDVNVTGKATGAYTGTITQSVS